MNWEEGSNRGRGNKPLAKMEGVSHNRSKRQATGEGGNNTDRG